MNDTFLSGICKKDGCDGGVKRLSVKVSPSDKCVHELHAAQPMIKRRMTQQSKEEIGGGPSDPIEMKKTRRRDCRQD